MTNIIKKIALSTILLGSSAYLMAGCPLNILNPEINPRPLTYLSTGNVSFEILEDKGVAIPEKDSFGDPTCLFNIELSYVMLENNDTVNITGPVLEYFDVEYNKIQRRIYFTQNKDIPADTYAKGIVSVDVTEESTNAQKYNGFQLNVYASSVEGSQFTYTKKQVLPPEVLIVDGTDVNETDPTTVITNDTTPEINGTCDVNNTVTVQIDGEDIEPTVDCSDDGTFSITPTEEIPEGEHNITATQYFPDENTTSAPSPVDYLNVDTTAPTAPIVTITEDIDNNGEISQANELNGNINALVTVPAGTKLGDVLTVTNPDGTIVNVPVTSDIMSNGYPLEYSPVVGIGPLSGVVFTVQAILRDQSGNVSPQSEDSATIVDDVAPETLTIDNVDGQTGTPITTTDTTPEINGTCTPDDNGTVVIQIDGVDITPTTICTADGTYSVSPDTSLTVGEHNVTALESDNAGNTKTTPAVALIVENTLPDYDVALSISKASFMNKADNFFVTIRITEVAGGVNTGDVVYSINKNSNFTLSFNNVLSTNPYGQSIVNSEFEWIETDSMYKLVYKGNGGVFLSKRRLFVGLAGVFTPPNGAKGIFLFRINLRSGTGDTNDLNDHDGDTISYSNMN